MGETNIILTFKWIESTPDPRPFQQQRHKLEVNVPVAVEIPLKHEYIYNSAEIIQAQLVSEKGPQVILTPLGMQYAVSKLEEPWPINEELGQEASEEEPEGFDWDANEDAVTSDGTIDDSSWGEDYHRKKHLLFYGTNEEIEEEMKKDFIKDGFDWDAEITTDDKPMTDEEFDWND